MIREKNLEFFTRLLPIPIDKSCNPFKSKKEKIKILIGSSILCYLLNVIFTLLTYVEFDQLYNEVTVIN